jgi:6-phosphogluconolactonase
MTRLLIGGYSGDKGNGSGITVLDNDDITATIPADSPSWIARHPDLPVLYAVAETGTGQVHAWSLSDGMPTASLGCGETGGAEPAHLTVDLSGRFLVTTNYSGGSVCVHRLGEDGSIGQRTDLVRHERSGEHPRQDGAHPHMAMPVAGGVLITDLGGDAIYHYELGEDGRLMLARVIEAPPEAGPRHALEIAGRYYVTAELSGDVLVYDAGGRLAGAVPASRSEHPNQPSELVSDGTYLYVANRGPDTVAVFRLGEELPRYLAEVPAGTWPRHIALDRDLLYIASQLSHELITMRIDPQTGIPAPIQTTGVPSPTCVLP